IGQAFGLRPGDDGYEELRVEFVERYEAALCRHTTLFPGVPEMLGSLESAGMPWGIVTNKVTRLTAPLVRLLGLDRRAACVVSGDTAARPKP
ncbi:HAD hydrolase-like protein, partial [Bacillus atrophaeus]|uniref:HAD hydrolase-like protein n=1 Tax=Bacillus atrophaeus TaxID=1452 RepID=UPI001EFAEC7F